MRDAMRDVMRDRDLSARAICGPFFRVQTKYARVARLDGARRFAGPHFRLVNAL